MYDIAIIGGGINGAGIARDAAGRGWRVLLVEQGDLAGATSSASTKLIHGGLRYLEHYDFRLVRESLLEREVLARIAPHNVRPMRFVLPHHSGLRPRWMLAAGLLLYDALGNKSFARTRSIEFANDEAGAKLKPSYSKGFSYSDCWTDDARLVVLNAIDAAERGAVIRTRTKLHGARRSDVSWTLDLGSGEAAEARTLVNAAGAWANDVIARAGAEARAGVRLVQGSHIVVRSIFDGDHAYIFQQGDGRVVFAIPFEEQFTLIGTTDHDFSGDPGRVEASADEVAYLCGAASEYFRAPVTQADVVWTYSGVRALYDDGASKAQEVTRDYVLSMDNAGAALLTIYGGKITTYRKLAESALASLSNHLAPAKRRRWTHDAPLPGGDFARGDVAKLAERLRAAHPFVTEAHGLRLARAYGTRAAAIFEGANDVGETFGGDLSAREVDYLVVHEWARTAQDVLWRRTKAGLRATPDDVARLETYLAARAIG